jgi:hypothetical protein
MDDGAQFVAASPIMAARCMDAWYADGQRETYVGTYTYDKLIIHVVRCGQMRWQVGDDLWTTAADISPEVTCDDELNEVAVDDDTTIHTSTYFDVFVHGYRNSSLTCGSIVDAMRLCAELVRELQPEW